MEQQERALLAIASRLLTYPPDSLFEERKDIKDCIAENITTIELLTELETAFTPLYSFTLPELRKLYVETFDLKAKNGLYLTGHELGDSTKRGAALIKLQKIIEIAGFDRVDDELADFIPMLFEFLAVAPNSQQNDRLVRRLAVAIQRIFNNLPKDNPYSSVFLVLMHIFPEPSKEEIEKLEFEREEADLEELPFPIMYL